MLGTALCHLPQLHRRRCKRKRHRHYPDENNPDIMFVLKRHGGPSPTKDTTPLEATRSRALFQVFFPMGPSALHKAKIKTKPLMRKAPMAFAFGQITRPNFKISDAAYRRNDKDKESARQMQTA